MTGITSRRLPSAWRSESFSSVVEDVTGGNSKVLARDYQPRGILPVIDQGQKEIAGFVDDQKLECRARLPCILFGDHTKVFKWIQYPFALGADGVKVLCSRGEVDPKYLFHFLRTVKFPVDAGYSRHFKYLKDVEIPFPRNPKEQQRIADILDKAETVRLKRQQTTSLAGELLRSLFLEMFGDPVANSRSWPLTDLKTLGQVITGNTPPRSHPEYYGSDIEWIKSDNINTPHHYLTKASEGLSIEGKEVGRVVPAGSTLVTCIAGSPDCIGNAALADRDVAFNQQINAITPYEGTEPHFLYALILNSKKLIQLSSSEAMKGMVSKSKFEDIQVIQVSPDLQAEFGKRFLNLLKFSRNLDQSTIAADELFRSLQQRAFCGELS